MTAAAALPLNPADLARAVTVMSDEPEAPVRPAMIEHPDGLYFDLPEDAYFRDPALGSSDMVRLFHNPAEYWFRSAHNPLREDDEPSEAKRRGTATHCLVLYGLDAFLARYAPVSLSGNTKAGKEERAAIVAAGKEPLKADDFNRIVQAGETIRRHRYHGPYLQGGCGEVSVFWTDAGVRKRARFDYLRPDAVVDLKTISNTRGIDFRTACEKQVSNYDYVIQAAHYWQAREHIRDFVTAGLVSGEADDGWLSAVADVSAWTWIWLFYQTTGAPLTEARSLDPRDPDSMALLDLGRANCRQATDAYRTHALMFGLDTPWIVERPVEPLRLSEMPAWWRPKL